VRTTNNNDQKERDRVNGSQQQFTPSYEACKEFVCKVLPWIILDLKRKGKLPKEQCAAAGDGRN